VKLWLDDLPLESNIVPYAQSKTTVNVKVIIE